MNEALENESHLELPINAHRNVWMLDMCKIWSENRDDGIGRWEEPSSVVDDYIDFYLETEYGEVGDDVWDGEKIVDYDEPYINSLLKPLFPQAEWR